MTKSDKNWQKVTKSDKCPISFCGLTTCYLWQHPIVNTKWWRLHLVHPSKDVHKLFKIRQTSSWPVWLPAICRIDSPPCASEGPANCRSDDKMYEISLVSRGTKFNLLGSFHWYDITVTVRILQKPHVFLIFSFWVKFPYPCSCAARNRNSLTPPQFVINQSNGSPVGTASQPQFPAARYFFCHPLTFRQQTCSSADSITWQLWQVQGASFVLQLMGAFADQPIYFLFGTQDHLWIVL